MRSFRLALVAVAVVGVVAPLAAQATQPPPPVPFSCKIVKTPTGLAWTEDVPVVGGQEVYTYSIQCYG